MIVAILLGVLTFIILWICFPRIFKGSSGTRDPRKVDLIYEPQDKLDSHDWLICLKNEYVRCIKTPDHFIYLPYDKPTTWSYDETSQDIVVNGIHIPFSLARDTSMQCWATSLKDKTVEQDEFNSYLRELKKSKL
jgi:hypothetical protein